MGRQKNFPSHDRQIAEVHYQLGISYYFDKQYETAKLQYSLALKVLEDRIHYLKNIISNRKDGEDKNGGAEEGEIEEIGKLLPEIKEKVQDMKDLIEEIQKNAKNKLAQIFGEGSSSSFNISAEIKEKSASPIKNSPVPSKPAAGISHLVKRKRENEPSESPAISPVKKVKVDEPVTNGCATETNGVTNGSA